YAALIRGRLEWLQVLNDDAGQIDDFLIGSPGRLDAFQVKYGEEADTYTLYSLLRPGKKDSGKPTDSLVRQLAAGWLRLTNGNSDQDIHVHLVMRGIPTKIGAVESLSLDSQQASFHEFLTHCWRRDSLKGEGKSSGMDWSPVLKCIEACSNLGPDQFNTFRTHCHFDFRPQLDSSTAVVDGLERSKESDIEKLKLHLLNLASADKRPGQISREQLLRELAWEGRFRSAYPHEFRVDPRYQPITATVEAIQKSVAQFTANAGLSGRPCKGRDAALRRHRQRNSGRNVIVHDSLRRGCAAPDGAARHPHRV
ncbi:MAG: hypothetical protein WBN22_14875, partial [Verrucomicrobiia bacterium]